MKMFQAKFNNLQLAFSRVGVIEMPPKKDSKKAEKKEGAEKAASTEKPKAAEGEPKAKKSGKGGKKEKK